ncbi:DNA polymerase I-like flap endonuclease (FEN) [Acaryochloris phage A-HIS1]|nr:DNA polymerase I-like flap endonuclease (FEN) [Acaryochloris phage A-HIS1]
MSDYNHRHANTGYPPLLIIDYRVIAWKVFNAAQNYRAHLYPQKAVINPETGETKWIIEDDGSKKKEFEEFVKLSWIAVMNRGPDFLPFTEYTAIVVDDIKTTFDVPSDIRMTTEEMRNEPLEDTIPLYGYWRHVYLRDHWALVEPEDLPLASKRPKRRHTHETLGYKGGRSEKTDTWLSVADIGLRYVLTRSNFHYLSKAGYEADDFAGAIVAAKRAGKHPVIRDREIYLYTVDRDWLQLVDRDVFWCNTAHYYPRFRDIEAAIVDIKKKDKATVSHPYEIVQAKAKYGDKSDNLPPGSPEEVIDLLSPPPEHRLLDQSDIASTILAAANDKRPNVDKEHARKAFLTLRNRGCPLVVNTEPYEML